MSRSVIPSSKVEVLVANKNVNLTSILFFDINGNGVCEGDAVKFSFPVKYNIYCTGVVILEENSIPHIKHYDSVLDEIKYYPIRIV